MCRTDTCDSNLPRPLYASRPVYFNPSFTSWRERGGGQVVRWVYNLHGKTREVIPCRNAGALVVAPSVQVRGLHASYIASISLHLFGIWIPKVSYEPALVLCRLL